MPKITLHSELFFLEKTDIKYTNVTTSIVKKRVTASSLLFNTGSRNGLDSSKTKRKSRCTERFPLIKLEISYILTTLSYSAK